MSLKSTIEQTCAYATTTRKPHTGYGSTLADDGYADYQYEKAKNRSSITSVEPLFWDKPAGWDKVCAERDRERAAGLLLSWTPEEARAEVTRKGASSKGTGAAAQKESKDEVRDA